MDGYSTGADLYMTKPVDGEELGLAITNLARELAQTKRLLAQIKTIHSGLIVMSELFTIRTTKRYYFQSENR
ncbi:hypothetical protein DEA98_26055 [Brucella pseudogrignonensis]|nr:hypothetical protein [Brucella pseudogrignonensis]